MLLKPEAGGGKKSVIPELVALALLVPLAIIIGLIIWRQPLLSQVASTAATSSPTPVLATPTATPIETAQVQGIITQSSTIASPSPSATPTITKTVTMTMQAPTTSKTLHLPVNGQVTVADMLKVAQDKGTQIKTKDFGGSLGVFVESMMGISNDLNTQTYWTLYINNIRAQVGASTATVSAEDSILWKYEHIEGNQ